MIAGQARKVVEQAILAGNVRWDRLSMEERADLLETVVNSTLGRLEARGVEVSQELALDVVMAAADLMNLRTKDEA